MFRLFHLLLCRKTCWDGGHGRVPAAMLSELEVRHHAVHCATDDVAGIHGAGSRLVYPLNVAGKRGPLARKAVSRFEGAVVGKVTVLSA
jgi:hypothetical protein